MGEVHGSDQTGTDTKFGGTTQAKWTTTESAEETDESQTHLDASNINGIYWDNALGT